MTPSAKRPQPVPGQSKTLQPDPAEADLYRLFLERAEQHRPIHKWHHYFEIYARFLSQFRGRAPTVLEIGVYEGGSLELWQQWFGPDARIFGVDVNSACGSRAPHGIKVFIGDQADASFMRSTIDEIGHCDIVIDDGGHTANQQITSFNEIYPRLAPDGVYIVEDTHTALWGGAFSDRPDGASFLDFAFDRCKDLHAWTGRHENFKRLGLPPLQRPGQPTPVPEFCLTTHAISFFDSMVVFERQKRQEPWHEVR